MHILRDMVRIIRAGEWWQHKIAPVLGTAYAVAVLLGMPFAVLWPLLLFLAVSLSACAAYVSVLNDICDLEDDLRAGKANRMQGRSPRFRAVVLVSCLLSCLGAVILLSRYPWACLLYTSNWLVFTLYSVPPVRLKTRGVWGVLMDACGSHLLPMLYAATLLAQATSRSLPPLFLISLGLWSLALGLRGILWHQLGDQENDRRAMVTTLVSRLGAPLVSRLATRVVFPIEVGAMILLMLQINTPWMWPLLMIYVFMEWQRSRYWGIDIVVVNATPNHRLVLTEYYELFYPMTFLLALGQREPIVWCWLGLHLLLFFRRTGQFFGHGLHLFRWNWWPSLKRRLFFLKAY